MKCVDPWRAVRRNGFYTKLRDAQLVEPINIGGLDWSFRKAITSVGLVGKWFPNVTFRQQRCSLSAANDLKNRNFGGANL